jgi:hypothetical protein
MITHRELEQLSAYLDGELPERERAVLEAHLERCGSCARVLASLRATQADLALLEAPVRDPRDSWALRAAIAKERKLARARTRWSWAAGAAAASLIAVALAVSLRGGGPETAGTAASFALAHGGSATLNEVAVDYDEASAQAALARLSGRDAFAAGAEAGPGAGTAVAPAPPAQPLTTGDAPADRSAAIPSKPVEECARAIAASTAERLAVREFRGASFKGTPAYLLFFEAPAGDPERIELWIVARVDCDILYFAQDDLR